MVCVSLTDMVVTKCNRLFGSGSGQIRFVTIWEEEVRREEGEVGNIVLQLVCGKELIS